LSQRMNGLAGWVSKNINIDKSTKSISIGKYYAVDGFSAKPIRVVTHIHSDHLMGLKDSLRFSSFIVGTPLTLDLIEEIALQDSETRDLFKAKKKPLNYGEKLEFYDSSLTPLENDHTFGACQILVEVDGVRVGYTGDIKLGGKTRIMKDLDVLIIESTYGSPRYRRPFKQSVQEVLIDTVRYGLRRYGIVHIYGYHGKLQEVMLYLRSNGIEEPFLMPENVFRATRILEKHNVLIGNFHKEREKDSFEQYVLFKHFNQAKYRRIDGSVLNIILTGWEFENPGRKIDEHTWVIALSDHADFDDLITYVEKSDPQIVVIDASRNGKPFELAEELARRGFITFVLPPKGE